MKPDQNDARQKSTYGLFMEINYYSGEGIIHKRIVPSPVLPGWGVYLITVRLWDRRRTAYYRADAEGKQVEQKKKRFNIDSYIITDKLQKQFKDIDITLWRACECWSISSTDVRSNMCVSNRAFSVEIYCETYFTFRCDSIIVGCLSPTYW